MSITRSYPIIGLCLFVIAIFFFIDAIFIQTKHVEEEPVHIAQKQSIPSPLTVGRMTGLPLPRFVSLKGEKTFMRRGPSKTHAVMWQYQKKGLPVEIVDEYDDWRKIRDMDGSEGWINQSVLSGRRTVLTLEGTHSVRSSAGYDSTPVAKIEGGMVAIPRKCTSDWCLLEHPAFEGWLPKAVLYGVSMQEVFD